MEKLQQHETTITPLIHSTTTWVNSKKTKLSPPTFNDPLQSTHFDSSQVNSDNKLIIANNALARLDSQNKHSTNSQISVSPHFFADPLQQNMKLEQHSQQQQQVVTHPLSFSKANHSIGHMLEDDNNPGETKGDDNVVHEQQLSAKSETYATTGHTNDTLPGVLGVVRNNPDFDESKEGGSGGQLTTAKIRSSTATITTTTTTTTATRIATESIVADNENHRSVTTITTERTVWNLIPADPLSPLNDDQSPARQAQRRPLRPRTLSSPVQSRVTPLEHLTNMGPLELEREIDSGVHLSTESSPTSTAPVVPHDFATVNPIVGGAIDNSVQQLQRLSLHPSTSTLVSETSRSSSTAADQDTGAEGMLWSGSHPLLMDYTAEPELLEDSNDYNFAAEKNRLNMRAKGHSMSVDIRQSSIQHQDANSDPIESGQGARRRRNISKANGDRSWTSRGDDDLGHGRSTTEATGMRVIIHQVTPTDTLAGIALYYGIQVSILKKSNKLWTNDSIHTRKYLYIPFEECTVTRQAGVMVDENNQTVFLPQRTQQQHRYHSRSGSAITPGTHASFTSSRMSTYDATIESTNNGLPNQQQTSKLQAIMESATGSGLGTELTSDKLMAISPPPISAVAAGMLPSTSSPLTTCASRIGTWIDAKSMDLPDTVVVPPSMTHEALAARFKEMDIISSEQQQRKLAGQEQELRINPIHQRHRTTDLRQFSNVQQILDSGKRSLPTSNAGSRRTSVDVGVHEPTLNSAAAGPLSRRGPALDSGDSRTPIEEEDEEGEHVGTQNKLRQGQDSKGFIAYGHHQHIYATDDHSAHGDYGDTSDRLSDANELNEDTTTLRRQELVTLPAGMLSFFPSSEHSKKLETPQSISRIQSQMGSYPHSTSSLSSLSSSGSFRGISSSRNGSNARVRGTRTKGRAALNDQTFQPPSSSSSATHSDTLNSQRQQSVPSSSSDTIHSRTNSNSNSRTSSYSKAVRVNQQQYFTPQKWSAMGESLVDDLLGAVRGPLQIARRVYNFTTLGFGAAIGYGNGSSGKDSLDFDSSSTGSVRRRTSTRSRSGRSLRNKEYRYSGPAIELDQANFLGSKSNNNNVDNSSSAINITTTTTAATSAVNIGGIETNVSRPVPTNLLATATVTAVAAADTTSPESSSRHSTRGSRRKSSSGHGHFSGSSSGGSTTRRSLRSTNPANHAALMALVNELDKEDKREKEMEKKKEKTTLSSASNNVVINPLSSTPIVDILATSF
ncbi:hypothetical protein BGZ80_002169 [Entomortierella chlamydospora]|uniref:LysM domain-containing protein n=1 Tax=Entomortierella chlamydospora TaxID=101097 RepID=A0A9P6MQ14_9FUNG|nr:hypothetical protein BGZ80_002169 [Entomortierella chlamydospora]